MKSSKALTERKIDRYLNGLTHPLTNQSVSGIICNGTEQIQKIAPKSIHFFRKYAILHHRIASI